MADWRASFDIYWAESKWAPGTTAKQKFDMKCAAMDAWRTLHEQICQDRPYAYLVAKLEKVVPLLQEARDALPAITEFQRKLHSVSPTLADRMDAAGYYSVDDWRKENPNA